MDNENGKRLNTKANVSDEQGETFRPPFSLVSTDTSSSSNTRERETNLEGSGCSNVALPNVLIESTTDYSPESIKQGSDVSFVLTESPPIQVMERPNKSSFDPNISARTDSPSRWSVDSNDSLFSIGMGNGSFSKDVSPSGDVLTAAGELSLSEAYLPRLQLYQSEEQSKSPAAKGDVNEDAVVEPKSEARISIHTDSNISGSSDIPHVPDPHPYQNKTHNEAFGSPATSEAACPMCKCLHCDGMDCCCRWPSCDCCCRWPSCCCSCDWFALPSCSGNCLSCCSCCNNKCCGSILFCACCNRDTKRSRSISSYA